jgi:hypothetical protein
MTELEQVQSALRTHFSRLTGDVPVDNHLLTALTCLPELTSPMVEAVKDTDLSYLSSFSFADISEQVMYIEHQMDLGLKFTPPSQIPIVKGLKAGQEASRGDSEDDTQTAVIYHTHPPVDPYVTPSTVEIEGRNVWGDLYALSLLRSHREPGRSRPYWMPGTLAIIQATVKNGREVQTLFVREGKNLLRLTDDEADDLLVDRFIDRGISFSNSGSLERVVEMLRDLDYQADYTQVKMRQFQAGEVINPCDFDRILQSIAD